LETNPKGQRAASSPPLKQAPQMCELEPFLSSLFSTK
jgi:hypothetical protein